jgi:glutamate-1-semialdehyde 2,1-aminomutase
MSTATPTAATQAQNLYCKARRIIPGGTQLLSKRPEMFAPGQWPGYFKEARGVEVIDIDGRRYIDMTTMGIGACLLGYADPDVNQAVVDRVQRGSMSSLNPPEEVELAEMLLSLHPWAQMARFARGGGEAMSVAVRIARAFTGRDRVAFCGYHGWTDWYLAANLDPADDRLKGHLLPGLEPAGVPSGLAGTALPFAYNQVDQLREISRQHGSKLAAIVMEPTRGSPPAPGFLEAVRKIADETGACLIFDEISIGFRLHHGGAHLHYGVMPDIAVFAKSLGNGIPVSAIIGTDRVMQAAQRSFISSTFWTDSLGPTAAIAVLKKMKQVNIPAHIAAIGKQYKEGLLQLSSKHTLPLKVGGHDAMPSISFASDQALALQTLLTVRMLDHGILSGSSFYPSLAHQPSHVEQFLTAADEVLAELAEAIRVGDVLQRIGGEVKHAGFARLA